MIQEYAVEPELLNTLDRVRLFLSHFGVGQGRLIVEFPHQWGKAVLEAFPNTAAGLTRARVAGLLTAARAAMASRGSVRWLPDRRWLDNAEDEYRREGFHAILARENPDGRDHLIAGDDIDRAKQPARWVCEPVREVERTGAAMAAAVGPLFRVANTVLFIDRNFDPKDGGFRAALAAFMNEMRRARAGRAYPRVEYHTGDDRHHPDDFEQLCQANLAGLLPRGLRVRFVRWRHAELHDRDIVSDRGGFGFGQGLDEAGDRETIRKVRITRYGPDYAGKLLDDFGAYGKKPRYTRSLGGRDVTVTGTGPE